MRANYTCPVCASQHLTSLMNPTYNINRLLKRKHVYAIRICPLVNVLYLLKIKIQSIAHECIMSSYIHVRCTYAPIYAIAANPLYL